MRINEKLRLQLKIWFIKATKGNLTLSEAVRNSLRIDKKYRNLIKEKHKPLWIPSINSFIKLLSFFFLVALLCNIGASSYLSSFLNYGFLNAIKIPVVKSDTPMFQNLISINAGIGSVLVGLAFFVAQSLMDKEDPDRARVLLYKSKFFILLTSEVFVFLILLTGNLNYLIFIVVGGLALATIYFLGNTIEILIRANDLENAKIRVFTDILKRNYIKIWNDEITRRISNNKLLEIGEELSKKYNGAILINPYIDIKSEKYYRIKAHLEGELVDIKLGDLGMLIDKIIRTSSTGRTIATKYESEWTTTSNTVRTTSDPIIVIKVLAFTSVNEESILLGIKRDVIEENPKLYNRLLKNIRTIFIIKKVKDSEEEARFEISKLKQRCIYLIDTQRKDDLKKTIKLYNELVKELFEYMKQYGGGFSKTQAENERTAFFGERFKPLDWISSDIREIYNKAMESNNIDIITIVAYMPISLAQLAIKYRDHLIYQNFIYYPQLMYIKGYKTMKLNEELASFLIDRSWRYITELSNFYLVHLYRDEEFAETDLKDFAFYLLKVFQSLLKQSYDNQDKSSFEEFIKNILKLFKNLDTTYQIRNSKSKDSLYNFLDDSKKQLLFGLGSWILYEYRRYKKEIAIEFLDIILPFLPSEIVDTTELFISIRTFEKEREW